MLQGPGIISRICGVKSPKIFATNTLNITVCHHQRCKTYWHPARCHGWSRPRVTRADGQETPENSHGWRPFLNEGWKNDWKQRRFSTTTSSPPYRRQSKRAYSAARLETAPSKNRVKLFFDQHGCLVLGLVDHHLDRACLPFGSFGRSGEHAQHLHVDDSARLPHWRQGLLIKGGRRGATLMTAVWSGHSAAFNHIPCFNMILPVSYWFWNEVSSSKRLAWIARMTLGHPPSAASSLPAAVLHRSAGFRNPGLYPLIWVNSDDLSTIVWVWPPFQ